MWPIRGRGLCREARRAGAQGEYSDNAQAVAKTHRGHGDRGT